MSVGWIRIERKLFDHQFFDDEPMSEREAWICMISRAAWENTQHRVGTQMLNVPRGAFYCTQRDMAQTFGWKSHHRVQGFWSRLTDAEMIEVRSAPRKKCLVIIRNYEMYQSQYRQEQQPTETHLKVIKTDPPAAQSSDMERRERLLVAMGLNPMGRTPSGRTFGTVNDMFEASKWSADLGLSLDEQLAVIGEITAHRARAGEPPPTSFKFYTQPMARYAALKNGPKLEPDAKGTATNATGRPKIRAKAKNGI